MPEQRTQSKELKFALDICAQAGKVAMRYFDKGIETETKYDGSPVTRADRECERLIREGIAHNFPADAILGEEEGESEASANQRRWIVDPIDGTYNYARGIPIFSTLLALEEKGEVVLGVVHNPAMEAIFWAEKGGGAYKNGERLKVSSQDALEQSLFNFGGPNRIVELGLWGGFTELIKRTYRQRGFGDYLGFAYVFEGKAEAMLEVDVKPWDLAPMQIIASEAGGCFTDLTGKKSIESGSCLVSNGILHDQFLALLKG